MGKIAQRISSRQSWAGKWADSVSRLLREERRKQEQEARDGAAEADALRGLLLDPIEELLACADRREFNRALDLLYSALSTQDLAEEADVFSLLLEDCAGNVYWEQGEGEDLRVGESQLFAVGLVAARPADAPEPQLDAAACERLRKALVDTHQVSARGRVVLLPVLLPRADELALDAWQERRLAQGLQDWASAHPGDEPPTAEQAQRLLALAGHDDPPALRAQGGKGLVALRSSVVLGLIVPPGEAVEDLATPEQDEEDEPIGKYFPRREMAVLLDELLDLEDELSIVLELRRGVVPQDVDPEVVAELKALYLDDRLVDLEADLEETQREIESLRQDHPQLAKAVESESYLEAYRKKLAAVLDPLMGTGEAAASLGLRHATEAGPLQEVVALTFEDHRLVGFEIGALMAARDAGRTDCKGLLAEVIAGEDPEALDVRLFDGGRLVHEARWPLHFSEDDDAAGDRLLEALDLLGIRLVHEAGQDEEGGSDESVQAHPPGDAAPDVPEAAPIREETQPSTSRPSGSRRGRHLH